MVWTPAKFGRRQREEQTQQPAREQHTKHAASRRQQQALGQELADEPKPPGADGGANGQLANARDASREQQVRHVRAGDEQDEHDRALHDEQHAPVTSHEILVQRVHLHVALQSVRLVVGGRDRVQVVGGLRERGARLETADQPEKIVALELRRKRERDPGVCACRIAERRRHHRHDRIGFAVNGQRLSDGPRIAAVETLPERVAQRDHLAAVGHIVAGVDQAARRRRYAEHREEVAGHAIGEDLLRLAAAGDGGGPWRNRRERAERAIALAQGHELRPRHRRQRHGRVRVVCVNEPGRFSEGQRLEQHRVDDAEHRCVGANPQRERKHRRQREARVPQERADAVADVLDDLFHAQRHGQVPCQSHASAVRRVFHL